MGSCRVEAGLRAAVGWTPASQTACGYSTGSTTSSAAYGSGTMIRVSGPPFADSSAGATSTTEALVRSKYGTYRGEARKERSPGPARSSGAIPATVTVPGPTSRPPVRAAISLAESGRVPAEFIGGGARAGRLLGLPEALQHPGRNVQRRVRRRDESPGGVGIENHRVVHFRADALDHRIDTRAQRSQQLLLPLPQPILE